ICQVLGFDYGLVDLVKGHEAINVSSFYSNRLDREEIDLIDALVDEHQQPLNVAHTLLSQKVKQTRVTYEGKVHPTHRQEEFPYTIVPILHTGHDGTQQVRGL